MFIISDPLFFFFHSPVSQGTQYANFVLKNESKETITVRVTKTREHDESDKPFDVKPGAQEKWGRVQGEVLHVYITSTSSGKALADKQFRVLSNEENFFQYGNDGKIHDNRMHIGPLGSGL